MKHEWRKSERNLYRPNTQPQKLFVPKFKFYMIHGEGNPNDDLFSEYIGVLYSLAYAIKMSPKSGVDPVNYFDYAVYPLEGVWDINEEAKLNFSGKIDKNTLVYDLMIRQPDFVTTDFAAEMLERTKKSKPHQLLDQVKFVEIEEGNCIQMMHLGSYDNEPQSFKKMDLFAEEQQLKRKSLIHREIYLSDARKTIPEKRTTVLRYQVE